MLHIILVLVLVCVHPSLACFCLPSYIIPSDGTPVVLSVTPPLSPPSLFSKGASSPVAILLGLRQISSSPQHQHRVVRGHRTQTYLTDKNNNNNNNNGNNSNSNSNTPWGNLGGGKKDKEPKGKKDEAAADKPNNNIDKSQDREGKKKGKIGRLLSAVGSAVRTKKGDDKDETSPPPKKSWFRSKSAQPPPKDPPNNQIDNAIAAIEERLASVRTELQKLQKKDVEPVPEVETNRLTAILKSLEEKRDRLLEEERKRRDERLRNKEEADLLRAAERREAGAKRDEIKKAERLRKERDELLRRERRALRGDPPTNATGVVAEAIDGARSYVYSAWESTLSKRAQWIVVCRKTRISPGEVVPVVAGGLDLLIVASKDGLKLHCIANSCPHLGTPLEIGPLERRKIDKRVIGPEIRTRTGGLPTTSVKKFPPNEDGCEECIVCPLHKTAFALESGEVRGEWCPYPPILGKLVGSNRSADTKLPTFELRTRGKNIEVRINSDVDDLYKND